MKRFKTMILFSFFLMTCGVWANNQQRSTTDSSPVFQCEAIWDMAKSFHLVMNINFSNDTAIYILSAENIATAQNLVRLAEGQRLGHPAAEILVTCVIQE